MRAGVERLARRWWAGELGAGGALLDALAAPLAWAWARTATHRAARLSRMSTRLHGLAVVSVGNLAVGGTGKTPVAAWVVERLLQARLRTTVIVGASGRDEALLHERWNPTAPVRVGRDRVAEASVAHAAGAQAVVLDDAFQHLHIARDLDVVLLSAEDPFPGRVLPRGPYRETPGALRRADVLVVTRRTASEADARRLADRAAPLTQGSVTAGACLVPRGLRRLARWTAAGGAEHAAEHGDELPRGPWLAVCAVGRPEAFAETVRQVTGGPVELLCFPDHHRFDAQDATRIGRWAGGRPVAVTAKDAVKLAPLASDLPETWVLTEELRWSWGEDDLRERLEALAVQAVGP